MHEVSSGGRTSGKVTGWGVLWAWMAALSAILVVPAILNRSVILYPDTIGYIRQFASAPPKSVGASQADPAAAAASRPDAASPANSSIHRERAHSYKIFATVLWMLGGLGLLVAAQAVWTALAMMLVVRRLLPGEPIKHIVVLAGTVAASPVAFFVCVALPDAFGGLLAAALAMLLSSWGRLGRAERWFWLVTVACAVAFHNGLAAVAASVCLAWLVTARWHARGRIGGGWAAAGAAAAGVLVLAGMPAAYALATHKPDGTPPFVLAHLLVDGPAMQILRDDCPTTHWVTCRYLGQHPVDEGEVIWGKSIDRTVALPGLNSLPLAEQLAMKREETIILRRLLARYPGEQLRVSAGDVARQFGDVRLDDFRQTDLVLASIGASLPGEARTARAGALHTHPQ